MVAEMSRIAITLCLQTQMSSGYVYLPPDERFSDLLNSTGVRRPESRGKFLALSDVTVKEADREPVKLPTTYINKSTIYLAAMWDANSGRGIGARSGYKPYPYVDKIPLPVSVQLPGYFLTGNIHCARGERAEQVLEERLTFLPLTDVEVRPLANGMWSNVPFIAVNREWILSLQEESTPLLKVPPSQS